MYRLNLAILVQPFWRFLSSTNNLVNYASEQEIALCNLNPDDPVDPGDPGDLDDYLLHPEFNVGAKWFKVSLVRVSYSGVSG
jgi:hypothetical protein